MRLVRHATILALAAAAAVAVGAGTAAAQEAPDGKKLFQTKTCPACHGRGGAKAIMMYPNLAGQQKVYALNQMNDIASGTRLSGPDARGYPRTEGMKDVMHLVSAEEREKIADYLSTLPAAPVKPLEQPLDEAKTKAAATLYEDVGCAGCHGPEGKEPIDPSYPMVAGQKYEYLVLQMKEMRDGVRKNGQSELMLPVVQELKDDQVDLLASYLSQIAR